MDWLKIIIESLKRIIDKKADKSYVDAAVRKALEDVENGSY